jgi:hypothetical protein
MLGVGVGTPEIAIRNKGFIDVSKFFEAGGDGTGFDFTDTTSMFEDIDGGDNVDTHGQSIGIILSKKFMGGKTAASFIAGQPELVTNGDFSTGDTTGWNLGAGDFTITVPNGQVSIERNGGIDRFSQAITTVVDRWYQFSLDVVSGTVYRAVAGSLAGGNTTPGSYTFFFKATATSTDIRFWPAADLTTVILDNISVKEVPGPHMISASSADRATYHIGANNQRGIEPDGVTDGYNLTEDLGDADTVIAAVETSDSQFILLSHGGVGASTAPFAFAAQGGSSSSPNNTLGTTTTSIDRINASPHTRNELSDVVADGSPHVMTMKSDTGFASTADPAFSGYSASGGWRFDGILYHLTIAQDPSDELIAQGELLAERQSRGQLWEYVDPRTFTDVVFSPDTTDLTSLFEDIDGGENAVPGGLVGAYVDLRNAEPGETFDGHIAGQTELWDNPTPTIVNAGGSDGQYNSSTQTFTNNAIGTNGAYPRYQFELGLTSGNWYYLEGRFSGTLGDVHGIRLGSGGADVTSQFNPSTGEFTAVVEANETYLEIHGDGRESYNFTLESMTVKHIDGHVAQTPSSADRPTLEITLDENHPSLPGIMAATDAVNLTGTTGITATPAKTTWDDVAGRVAIVGAVGSDVVAFTVDGDAARGTGGRWYSVTLNVASVAGDDYSIRDTDGNNVGQLSGTGIKGPFYFKSDGATSLIRLIEWFGILTDIDVTFTVKEVSLTAKHFYDLVGDGVTDHMTVEFGTTIAQPNFGAWAGKYNVVEKTFMMDGTSVNRNALYIETTTFSMYANTVLNGPAADTDTHIVCGLFDDADGYLRVDGEVVASGAVGNAGSDGLTILADYLGARQVDGKIGGIFFMSREPTRFELASIEYHLNQNIDGVTLP